MVVVVVGVVARGGGVTQAGEPLMTASTNLEHMELSIARDTTSLANTAHVSHAGGQKMFAFKSPQHRKQTSTAEPPPTGASTGSFLSVDAVRCCQGFCGEQERRVSVSPKLRRD